MPIYYTVYKITNKINGKIYIGLHKTNDLNDGYMGSGKSLKIHQKKFGLENFEKEILFVFDNPEEMIEKEEELVNEGFVARKDTYNRMKGGIGGWGATAGTVMVKDKDGNCFRVRREDPRYLSGELKSSASGRVSVRDEKGNSLTVDTSDPRYISGQLKSTNVGRKHTDESKAKMSKAKEGRKNPMYGKTTIHTEESKKKIGEINSFLQKGSKNSQYGTFWIYNEVLKENKKIKQKDPIPEGWFRGRKMFKKDL